MSWERIERWLQGHASLTYAMLRPGASREDVDTAQREIGVRFPADLVTLLLRHDGTIKGAGALGLAGDYRPMSVAEIRHRWRVSTEAMREVDVDGEMIGSYWHPQWVMFADTSAVDGLVVDCRAGETRGRVGVHVKGDGTHFGRWSSIEELLATVAEALEQGGRVDHWAPAWFSGRLTWTVVLDSHPNPRSLLTGGGAVAADPRFPPSAGAGVCLTLVEGIGESELLDRYGAVPGTRATRTAERALELQTSLAGGYQPVVRVGRAGAWAFGVEIGRWEGIRPATLRRLSAGTRTIGVHHSMFTHVRVMTDGELITSYDTRDPARRAGREPDQLLAALSRAGLVPRATDRAPQLELGAVLDLLAAEFGVRFDLQRLGEALLSAQFLPMLPDPVLPGPLSARSEPEVAVLIAYASEEQLHAALLDQARRLAAESGLDSYAEVAGALAAPAPAPIDDDSALGRRLRLVAAEATAAFESRREPAGRSGLTEPERLAWANRRRAAEALVTLLSVSPREAAPRLLLARLDPNWRAQFAADLGPVHVPPDAISNLLQAEENAQQTSRRTLGPLSLRPGS